MASPMKQRILISLLFMASTLTSSLSFADSPAMMDDTMNYDAEPEFIDPRDDARPAEASAVKTETQKTGTVLNTSGTSDKPMLVKQFDFPRRGMSEDKVRNELGEPNEITPAIGTPPISQWTYNDRIVYFEHATVLHVVAK